MRKPSLTKHPKSNIIAKKQNKYICTYNRIAKTVHHSNNNFKNAETY